MKVKPLFKRSRLEKSLYRVFVRIAAGFWSRLGPNVLIVDVNDLLQ